MVRWISQSFWVADLMVLAVLAFFILLGAMDIRESGTLAIVVAALTAVGALHLWLMHRRVEELSLSPESRAARERRGF